MNNKRKKSNFLKNLLTTASVASVIVGASSSAFAVAQGRITHGNNSNLVDANWSNVDDAGVVVAVVIVSK